MRIIKKAFTLVELLVVIAILAVLATVGIISYGSFKQKAAISNDITLVRQVNDILMDEEVSGNVPNNMYEAKEMLLANQYGIDISAPKISTKGYHLGYDVRQNRVVLIDNLTKVSIIESASNYKMENAYDIFVPVDSFATNCVYSQYLNKYATDTSITTDKGVDAGDCYTLQSLNYSNINSAKDVVIRTNSEATVLSVTAPLDEIYHYGSCGIVNLNNVSTSSYYEYGVTSFIELNIGRVVLTKTSDVEIINVSKKDANSYNNPIIADGGVLPENMPDIISRDQVEVTAAGGKTELVQIQKVNNKGVVEGTVEQIYAYANGTAGTTEKTNVQNPTVSTALGLIVLDNSGLAGQKAYAENDINNIKDQYAPKAFNSEVLGSQEYMNCNFRIGAVGYNTLEAINSTINSSCTIYMLKDYTQTTGIEFLDSISGKDVVLDLSGHTLFTMTWFDIHNANGTSTIQNGIFAGNARIYMEKTNGHLVLNNITMQRNYGTSNKYIMFSVSDCTLEVNKCNIIGNPITCEYFIGNFKGGEKIIIKDTTINTGKDQWLDNDQSYNKNKESYIELQGTSAQAYTASNLKISANYSISYDVNGIRYTLCASKENWSTHTASSFANIDTSAKTISISTAAELALFAKNVRSGTNYAGYTVSLSADIDISSYEWLPIGYYDSNDTSVKFAGIFDGNNHKITGMTIASGTTTNGVGLFGSVSMSSQIKNVEVNGNIFTARYYVGGIVGHGYTTITNCTFKGNISGSNSVGGILGSGYGVLTNCNVIGNISGERWVGGLIGNAQEDCTATNCSVNGDITALYRYAIDDGAGNYITGFAGAGAYYGLATQASTYNANCTYTGTVKEAGTIKENQYISGYAD